jgi:hypothetical protein
LCENNCVSSLFFSPVSISDSILLSVFCGDSLFLLVNTLCSLFLLYIYLTNKIQETITNIEDKVITVGNNGFIPISIKSFVLFLEVKLTIEGLILTSSGILGVGLVDEDNIGEGEDITGEGDEITGGDTIGEGDVITGGDTTGEGDEITGEGDDIIEGPLFVIFFPTFSDT